MNLDIPNHKESPEILSEMEEATGISTQPHSGLSRSCQRRISILLDRQPVGSVLETLLEENTDDQSSTIAPRSRTAQLASRFGLPFGGRTALRPRDAASLRPPSSLSETDKKTRAFRVLVQLRQPFGVLLLTQSRGSVAAYKRVAAESLITVQVEEITSAVLNKLMEDVSVLDVLLTCQLIWVWWSKLYVLSLFFIA
ncbi:hypothetical protein EV363DRAFT_1297830 [Boletus edulis]|nr:hypothetical protein EV363DRAFT_1297830 [Boletus edulis]